MRRRRRLRIDAGAKWTRSPVRTVHFDPAPGHRSRRFREQPGQPPEEQVRRTRARGRDVAPKAKMQLRGSAGFSSLPYDWHDLVPANLWDEASGIQFELAEELMLPEEADRVFPDMPTPLCMRGKTRPTLFAAEAQTVIVDPKEFIPAYSKRRTLLFSGLKPTEEWTNLGIPSVSIQFAKIFVTVRHTSGEFRRAGRVAPIAGAFWQRQNVRWI